MRWNKKKNNIAVTNQTVTNQQKIQRKLWRFDQKQLFHYKNEQQERNHERIISLYISISRERNTTKNSTSEAIGNWMEKEESKVPWHFGNQETYLQLALKFIPSPLSVCVLLNLIQ